MAPSPRHKRKAIQETSNGLWKTVEVRADHTGPQRITTYTTVLEL